MQIHTTRFGPLETETYASVHFPAGLLGFPEIKDYILIASPDEGPFKWLQAVPEPDLAFVVMDPYLIMEDYRIEVSADDLRELHARDNKRLWVMVILTITQPEERPGALKSPGQNGRPRYHVTANFQGPIVVNRDNSWGKQLVLVRSPYHTRHVLPLGRTEAPYQEEEHETSGRCA